MYTEHECGCMWSVRQGRVRICERHRAEKADGTGNLYNLADAITKGKVLRRYSANGTLAFHEGL